jgi:hypothetical protein
MDLTPLAHPRRHPDATLLDLTPGSLDPGLAAGSLGCYQD